MSNVINNITKNDTTYAVQDARVDGMKTDFVATYGVTPFATLEEHYLNGENVAIIYENQRYEVSQYVPTGLVDEKAMYFSKIYYPYQTAYTQPNAVLNCIIARYNINTGATTYASNMMEVAKRMYVASGDSHLNIAYEAGQCKISSNLNDKQDVLTAGSNITISGNTISATDTTYSEATTSAAGLESAADKTKLDGIAAGATAVSVSASGTATDEVQYITVNGVEKKLAGGGGSAEGAVRYDTTQSLTNTQKNQVFSNLSLPYEYVDIDTNIYGRFAMCSFTNTTTQKTAAPQISMFSDAGLTVAYNLVDRRNYYDASNVATINFTDNATQLEDYGSITVNLSTWDVTNNLNLPAEITVNSIIASINSSGKLALSIYYTNTGSLLQIKAVPANPIHINCNTFNNGNYVTTNVDQEIFAKKLFTSVTSSYNGTLTIAGSDPALRWVCSNSNGSYDLSFSYISTFKDKNNNNVPVSEIILKGSNTTTPATISNEITYSSAGLRIKDNVNASGKLLYVHFPEVDASGEATQHKELATTDQLETRIPAQPAEDGNYVLKCSIVDGVATYSWEAQS